MPKAGKIAGNEKNLPLKGVRGEGQGAREKQRLPEFFYLLIFPRFSLLSLFLFHFCFLPFDLLFLTVDTTHRLY